MRSLNRPPMTLLQTNKISLPSVNVLRMASSAEWIKRLIATGAPQRAGDRYGGCGHASAPTLMHWPSLKLLCPRKVVELNYARPRCSRLQPPSRVGLRRS
jgi:hypothetical protein